MISHTYISGLHNSYYQNVRHTTSRWQETIPAAGKEGRGVHGYGVGVSSTNVAEIFLRIWTIRITTVRHLPMHSQCMGSGCSVGVASSRGYSRYPRPSEAYERGLDEVQEFRFASSLTGQGRHNVIGEGCGVHVIDVPELGDGSMLSVTAVVS